MATANLKTEYSPLLDKRFTQKSLTEAWCGHDYNWEGDESIKVWSIDQLDINDYSTTGVYRFTGGNAPTNIGDTISTYTLKNKKSFAGVIDMVVNQDQANIKKANSILKQVWDEQIVPLIDQDRLKSWANGAGTAAVGTQTLSTANVIRQILTANSVLNNNLVNRDGRVCFITETKAIECRLASELQYNESFTEKAIVNGQIAKLGGMPIVSVPDSYMPTGVEMMVKYKRASADPRKLKMLRANDNVPGIAGSLIEGLVRFDSFVLAQKAFGVYIFGTTGINATPTITNSGTTGTISAGAGNTGVTITYTLDGSNPKTSDTATSVTLTGTAITTTFTCTTSGTMVARAYVSKSGALNSGIASHVCV